MITDWRITVTALANSMPAFRCVGKNITVNTNVFQVYVNVRKSKTKSMTVCD